MTGFLSIRAIPFILSLSKDLGKDEFPDRNMVKGNL